jgi:hypothetical protein
VDERVRFVAGNSDLAFKKRVVLLDLIVSNRPVCQSAPGRQGTESPALFGVSEHLKMMGMESSQPAAIMNDGAADAVHHSPE